MSDLWRIVLTTLVGVGTGVLSAMFGVGGAVVSTPAIRALGASPLDAVGSTLPSILPSSITGTIHYRREHLVLGRVVAWTAAVGVVAAVGGALLTDVVPGRGHPLMILTAILVAITAFRLATAPPDPEARTDARPEDEEELVVEHHHGAVRDHAWRLVLIGIVAGGMSGLLGVGGGTVMVPAFTGWLRLPIKVALATSLACVGVLAIPSMITHAFLGHIDWTYALPLCVGVVPGARLGARFTIKAPERLLRIMVGVVLGAIALGYAVGEILALA